MNKILSILVCGLLLQSCGPRETVVIKTYTRQFEVLDINQPKHFSVTLLDVQNHKLFEGVGRSKHCNSWDDNGRPKLNDVITVKVYTYYFKEDPNTLYYDIDDRNLNDIFCS